MKFSSELFQANRVSTDRAKYMASDLYCLLSAEPEIIDSIVEIISSADYDDDVPRFVDTLCKTKEVNKSMAESIVRAIRFIVTLTLSEDGENDEAEDWADDLIALQILEEDSRDKYIELVNRVKRDITPESKTKVRKHSAADGWMPGLTSINTTTELRAVNKNEFTIVDDISNYDAEIVDVVGVVSIRISVDDGEPNVLHFQAGRKDLNHIINKLKASLIELDALERFIKE